MPHHLHKTRPFPLIYMKHTLFTAYTYHLHQMHPNLCTYCRCEPHISLICSQSLPHVSLSLCPSLSLCVVKPVSDAGDQSHKMSTERCVHLIVAGLSNRVKEMWIGQQPFLLFFYLWQYTPTFAWYITNLLGRKRVQNFKAGLVRKRRALRNRTRIFLHPDYLRDVLMWLTFFFPGRRHGVFYQAKGKDELKTCTD